jgi:hypothetical protein
VTVHRVRKRCGTAKRSLPIRLERQCWESPVATGDPETDKTNRARSTHLGERAPQLLLKQMYRLLECVKLVGS